VNRDLIERGRALGAKLARNKRRATVHRLGPHQIEAIKAYMRACGVEPAEDLVFFGIPIVLRDQAFTTSSAR
jgi:hypothetical protein